jgi:HlyD family secretion protein
MSDASTLSYVSELLDRLPGDLVPREPHDRRRQAWRRLAVDFTRRVRDTLRHRVPSGFQQKASLKAHGPAAPARTPTEIRTLLLAGTLVVALLVGGIGGWASTTSLAGAVIVPGTVVVDTSSKKIQHPVGGVVGEIRVADGDHVAAGAVLVRLDDTATRANLLVITKQLDEIAIRQARLRAERDDSERLNVPEELTRRLAEPPIGDMIAGETSLFESRRAARIGQKAQLNERMAQLREEIEGLSGQRTANEAQRNLIDRELAGVNDLYAKNLVPLARVNALRRDASRLEGEQAQLTATLAQARGKIAETELQSIQIDQDLRTEVVKEMRELQGKEAELAQRRITAEDQLERIEIRAPQAGIIHQLALHTVGGVVAAGETLMMIVPDGDALVVEARIAPQDIDHVHIGQEAFIRFPAFNQRKTPEFRATVARLSADATKDAQTGQSYFLARLVLGETERQKLGSMILVPGMPAEAHIQTEARSALSYFIKPLEDQISKAFREP